MIAMLKQPNLTSPLFQSVDPLWKRLLGDIRAEHGLTRAVQKMDGAPIGFAYDEDTNTLYVNRGNSWQAIGQGTAEQAAVLKHLIETANSGTYTMPLTLTKTLTVAGALTAASASISGNITVGGTVDTVDVSTHNHGSGGGAILDAKDRWGCIDWAETENISGYDAHWFGTSLADTGYKFPYPVHITKISLTVDKVGAALPFTLQLYKKRAGEAAIILVDIHIVETEPSGWYRVVQDQNLAITTDDQINMSVVSGFTSNDFFQFAVRVEYTIDN